MRCFFETSKRLNSSLKKSLSAIPNTVTYKEDEGVTVYLKVDGKDVLLCDVIIMDDTIMMTPASVFGKKLERIIDQEFGGDVSPDELSSIIFDLNDESNLKEIDVSDLTDPKAASKVVSHVKSLAKKLEAVAVAYVR